MTKKQKIISAYLFISLLFAIYGWLFGQFKYRSFFYNFGKGIMWPVTMFPALGGIISAIIIVMFVVAVLVFGQSNNNEGYGQMLRWAPLILLTAVTACSKLDHFYQKKSEYQQECLGDQSVKCRSILVDLNVTKLEAAIQMAGSRKENIIACRGQRFYDEGLEVIQEKIAYFKELKPGIFARVFLSGAQVEFDPPPFRREPDYRKFIITAGECENHSGSVAPAPAASPAPPALTAELKAMHRIAPLR